MMNFEEVKSINWGTIHRRGSTWSSKIVKVRAGSVAPQETSSPCTTMNNWDWIVRMRIGEDMIIHRLCLILTLRNPTIFL